MIRYRLASLIALGMVAACSASEDKANTGSDDIVAHHPAAAKNALRIPLLAEDLKTEASSKMSAYNDKLKAEHVGPIPDFIDVDGDAAAQKYSDFRSQFSDAAYKLKLPVQDFTRGIAPDGYADAGSPICYIGDPHKVVDLIMTSVDVIFTEQLGIHGWRYKAEKFTVDDDPDTDFGNDIPEEWKNWKGDGEGVLVLTHTGDGGDDVGAAVIEKCAP